MMFLELIPAARDDRHQLVAVVTAQWRPVAEARAQS